MARPPPARVVFDFDHTLIDVNSDPFVVRHLSAAAGELLVGHSFEQSWVSLMGRCFQALHAEGIDQAAYTRALQHISVPAPLHSAVQHLGAVGVECSIVSGGNMFFIESVLHHVGLRQCFARVEAYPASFDPHGCLRIYDHPLGSGPCQSCAVNAMCKGLILSGWPAHCHRTVFVGDGSNDLCACLALARDDVALVRDGFTLSRLLEKEENRSRIQASVRIWKDYDELARLLLAAALPTGGNASAADAESPTTMSNP